MSYLDSIDYVPAAHQSGGVSGRKANIIVMHSMECTPADRNVTNWVRALATPAGSTKFATYYTGPGVTYRVAELGRTVPHVGNGNQDHGGVWTLGIEQAGYAAQSRQQWISSGALNTSKPLLDALIADGHGARRWLTAADMTGPNVRGVTSHNEMRLAFGGTTHTDPGPGYPVDLLLAAPAGSPPPPSSNSGVQTIMAVAQFEHPSDKRMEKLRINLITGKTELRWQTAQNGPWVPGWTVLNTPGAANTWDPNSLSWCMKADGNFQWSATNTVDGKEWAGYYKEVAVGGDPAGWHGPAVI